MNPDEILQISISHEEMGKTYMKCFTYRDTFEFIPTSGDIDSVKMNTNEWNTLVKRIEELGFLNHSVDEGSWSNTPKTIIVYISTKENVFSQRLIDTNKRVYNVLKEVIDQH